MTEFYQPLHAWIASLQQNRDMLDKSDRRRILEDFHTSRPVRDAFIMTVLTDRRGRDMDTLNGFINEPYTPDNENLMRKMLEDDFHKPVDKATKRRAQTVIGLLDGIIREAGGDRELVVQPLAVKSYVEWFTRNPNGLMDSRMALTLDDTCSLAEIVHTAYECDMYRG